MSKVLVTGASGFVGSHLAKRLLQDGHDVRVFIRPGRDVSELELLGAEIAYGDLVDAESVNRAMNDIEVVYHIAAAFRQAKLSDSTYWDINFHGAVNLFKVALEVGVTRFLHCSTVGVLGHMENPPGDESLPYKVENIYQITKSEAEKAALAFHEDRGFPVTVIRPAGIYGPGDLRWLKLFKSIAWRRFAMLGSGETLIHLVYISDLVDAFVLAAENPNAVGKVYIAAGERYVTLNELTSTIAKTVGVSDSFLHIPFKPVRVLSGVVEDVCKVLRVEPPIYRRRVDFFAHDRAFDITRARTELGYSPKVSLEEGIRRTADWYKEQRLI
ncbi:MAG TPA: NAD-dependent epimerase/dehydratase family protein [Armatimonadota bacterium]|nr:NAD-dependent epimerase/dehydratase family protein [Armatimonadota bacterium]